MGNRLPVTLPQQPFGTTNPVPTTSGGRVPQPNAIKLQGPAQGVEQFNHPGIPDSVNRQLNALQNNVSQATAQAKANPLVNGNLITGINFVAATPVVINHGLGRPFAGYLLCNQRRTPGVGAALPIDVLQIDNVPRSLDATQITLESDGTYTADVLVY